VGLQRENKILSADITHLPETSLLPLYHKCDSGYCSPKIRHFTECGNIYKLFSYCNSTLLSSAEAHNDAKTSHCINNEKFASFKTSAAVWMRLPVLRACDAASLSIQFSNLPESFSSSRAFNPFQMRQLRPLRILRCLNENFHYSLSNYHHLSFAVY
jgi:hypothetical protein